MRWAWLLARMREKINAYWILVGKLEGNRPLGRPRRRWENNIMWHTCWKPKHVARPWSGERISETGVTSRNNRRAVEAVLPRGPASGEQWRYNGTRDITSLTSTEEVLSLGSAQRLYNWRQLRMPVSLEMRVRSSETVSGSTGIQSQVGG
jgi:hypothetical protein